MGDTEITVLLERAQRGDGDAADELARCVLSELKGMANKALADQRRDHTLDATALVHEAWMRLVDAKGQAPSRTAWDGRGHFFRVAATAMRTILVDHARAKRAAKRDAGGVRVSLESLPQVLADFERRSFDLVALDAAMQELGRLHARPAQVVELRFFAGLEQSEVARVLDLSISTVERDWRVARAWLRARLSDGKSGE